MKLLKMVLILSASCSLAACAEKRIATALPTPPERLVCEGVPASRPALPPQYEIAWGRIGAAASVSQALGLAREEFASYRAREIRRNGIVAGYLLEVEGRLYVCSNNAQWRREYEAGLPR